MLTHKHPDPKFMKELPRMEPLIMDSTASKLFKACPRKYFFRIVLGRVVPNEVTPPYFVWGSALHKFYEILEKEGLAPAITFAGTYKPNISEEFKKFDFLDKTRFIKTVSAISTENQKEKAQGKIKVVATEQPFNVELPDGSFIGGRFDQVLDWNGDVWIRDFKTTSKPKMYFQRQMDPNDQAMRYLYAATLMHLGKEKFDRGFIIKGIIFQAIYNAKTVGPEIYSIIFSKNGSQVRKWLDDQMFLNKIISSCREADTWPMAETGNCSYCEYATVCRMPSEQGMVQIMKNNYKFQPWDFNKVDQESE